MEILYKAINWSRVEATLLNHYTVGTSGEGADVYSIEFKNHSIRAYPPLLLFKAMLLRKWFHPRGIGSAPVELYTPPFSG